MSLNIKDEEVHRLAREIARATGQSMTQVIREALQERHRQLRERRRKASAAELLAIARRVSDRVEGAAPDHGSPALRRPGGAAVILDTSAPIVIFYGEPKAEAFASRFAPDLHSFRVRNGRH